MLNSKEDEQVLRRLQRLKNDIVSAVQYLQLDKCASKLTKIKQSVAAQSDRRRRKEWESMVSTCEELMREKTKYFKKLILHQLNSPTKQDTPQAKSLKGSKSMQNFQLTKSLSPMKQHKSAARQDNSLWNDKTQVIGQRLQREVEALREELQFYRKKVEKLEGHRSGGAGRLEERETLVEEQFAYRLREKGLEMEEMKGRLRYYEDKNQDLKNRLLNEQKRQDDYVNGLKGHIERLGADLDAMTRQNRRLHDELAKYKTQCETIKAEARHFFEESESLQREKKQMQSLQILRMKQPNVKRDLEALAQQQKFMREMQALLQTERQEKSQLMERIERLQHQLKQLDSQQTDLQKENARLAEALEIRNEEVEGLKKQVLMSIEERRQYQLQVEKANQRFVTAEQQLQGYRNRRNEQLQRKSANLRQIREILQCR